MRKRWKGGLVATSFMTVVASLGHQEQSALAYNLFSWSWTNVGALQYNYSSGVPDWLSAYVDKAAGEWTQTPTPAVLKLGSNPVDVWVSTYSDPNDSAGGHGGCGNIDANSHCVSGSGYAKFNLATGPRSDAAAFDQCETLHELGHALGLAHSGDSSSPMAGPQDTGPSGNYTTYSCGNGNPQAPTQDDYDALNALYPTDNGQVYNCYLTLVGGAHANVRVSSIPYEVDGTWHKTGLAEPGIPC